MSGGVDSSVAACLLREQGYEVIGLFMRTGAHDEQPAAACSLPVIPAAAVEPKPHKRGCCSASDAGDARRVADKLEIPFYALDFEHEFGRIMDYFVEEYTHGRTPNPCVMCNNWLKFGRLWEYARQIGADSIATGHYARIANCESPIADRGSQQSAISNQQFGLLRAADSSKDQSYVLYGINRQILPHLMFPVGDYSKPQIREIARELGLRVADKPDSQEICFVPSNDYQSFIRQRVPEFDGSGEIVDTDGNTIARHNGFEGYTVGQRRGLGVALGERRYVVQIDAGRHRVVIGSRDELLRRTLRAGAVNWLCEPPTEPFRCDAKIRYLHAPAAATAMPIGAGEFTVEFDEPQSAITPGQAVVLYLGDRVLGGGTIID
jgi:tRNA-specific 2-thiouridylase